VCVAYNKLFGVCVRMSVWCVYLCVYVCVCECGVCAYVCVRVYACVL